MTSTSWSWSFGLSLLDRFLFSAMFVFSAALVFSCRAEAALILHFLPFFFFSPVGGFSSCAATATTGTDGLLFSLVTDAPRMECSVNRPQLSLHPSNRILQKALPPLQIDSGPTCPLLLKRAVGRLSLPASSTRDSGNIRILALQAS